MRLGASPRAAIWLIRSAQAHAVLSARGFVAPDDVKAVAVGCLAHRILTDEGDDTLRGGPADRGRHSRGDGHATTMSRRVGRWSGRRAVGSDRGSRRRCSAGWWLVAHNSGAGWVQALGDVAFGMLVIGIVGPAVVLARGRVRVLSAPTDATAGLPVEVARRSLDPSAHPPGRAAGDRRASSDRSGGGSRRRTPSPWCRRAGAPTTFMVVDVATAAPFALQWWTRRMALPLPSTLMSPRVGASRLLLAVRPTTTPVTASERVPADVGEPRGARPYRPGDDRRQVHWQAFAHTGELMVREREGPAAEPVTLRVALPDDADEAERIAERALGTVVHLLERGAPVLLGTVEASGPVRGPSRTGSCRAAAGPGGGRPGR